MHRVLWNEHKAHVSLQATVRATVGGGRRSYDHQHPAAALVWVLAAYVTLSLPITATARAVESIPDATSDATHTPTKARDAPGSDRFRLHIGLGGQLEQVRDDLLRPLRYFGGGTGFGLGSTYLDGPHRVVVAGRFDLAFVRNRFEHGGVLLGARAGADYLHRLPLARACEPDFGEGFGYGYLWWRSPSGDAFTAHGHGGQFAYCVPALGLVVAVTADPNSNENLVPVTGPDVAQLVQLLSSGATR